jgi:hypothetical protein
LPFTIFGVGDLRYLNLEIVTDGGFRGAFNFGNTFLGGEDFVESQL